MLSLSGKTIRFHRVKSNSPDGFVVEPERTEVVGDWATSKKVMAFFSTTPVDKDKLVVPRKSVHPMKAELTFKQTGDVISTIINEKLVRVGAILLAYPADFDLSKQVVPTTKASVDISKSAIKGALKEERILHGGPENKPIPLPMLLQAKPGQPRIPGWRYEDQPGGAAVAEGSSDPISSSLQAAKQARANVVAANMDKQKQILNNYMKKMEEEGSLPSTASQTAASSSAVAVSHGKSSTSTQSQELTKGKETSSAQVTTSSAAEPLPTLPPPPAAGSKFVYRAPNPSGATATTDKVQNSDDSSDSDDDDLATRRNLATAASANENHRLIHSNHASTDNHAHGHANCGANCQGHSAINPKRILHGRRQTHALRTDDSGNVSVVVQKGNESMVVKASTEVPRPEDVKAPREIIGNVPMSTHVVTNPERYMSAGTYGGDASFAPTQEENPYGHIKNLASTTPPPDGLPPGYYRMKHVAQDYSIVNGKVRAHPVSRVIVTGPQHTKIVESYKARKEERTLKALSQVDHLRQKLKEGKPLTQEEQYDFSLVIDIARDFKQFHEGKLKDPNYQHKQSRPVSLLDNVLLDKFHTPEVASSGKDFPSTGSPADHARYLQSETSRMIEEMKSSPKYVTRLEEKKAFIKDSFRSHIAGGFASKNGV